MDIKKYLDVLSKKQQFSILKLVNKKLTRIPGCPGLQTHPDLHHYQELEPLIVKINKYTTENFKIIKCWANHTDGSYISWHTHNSDLSIVYYLKNKESIGTVFCINNKIISLKGLENSLIIFDSKIIHSVPSIYPGDIEKGKPKINRYSIAFELSVKNENHFRGHYIP